MADYTWPKSTVDEYGNVTAQTVAAGFAAMGQAMTQAGGQMQVDVTGLNGRKVSVQVPLPQPQLPQQTVTIQHLMGVPFAIQEPSNIPFGDVVWDRWDNAIAAWGISKDTWVELRSRSNAMQQSIVGILKERRKGGDTVVAGIVSANSRTPAAPRERKANLDSLHGRAKALVVQIATLLDAGGGEIPPGQVGEISQTYAALQEEHDALVQQMMEIESHLSMARGLVIEYATS